MTPLTNAGLSFVAASSGFGSLCPYSWGHLKLTEDVAEEWAWSRSRGTGEAQEWVDWWPECSGQALQRVFVDALGVH